MILIRASSVKERPGLIQTLKVDLPIVVYLLLEYSFYKINYLL